MRDIPNGSGGTMSDPPKKTVSTSDDKSGVGTTNEDAVTASSPSIAIAKCNMDTTSKISIAPDPVSNSLFGLSDNSLAIPELSNPMVQFSLEDIRIPQDYVAEAAVEDLIGDVDCRKPAKNEFVRVLPGEEWQELAAVIEDPEEKQQLWMILLPLLKAIDEEVNYVLLRMAINRFGVPFIWPLKMSRNGSKPNPWNQSAMIAAAQAESHWIKIVSSREAGRYLIKKSVGNIPEPVWPQITFTEAINRAFLGRIINDYNHPFLRKLRGEV